MSFFKDVGDFHHKFELPVSGQKAPTTLAHTEFRYRMAFIMEEIQELIEAHSQSSLVGCADALADIVWVVLGTAHCMHIPFDEVWEEVRRSNMEKRRWQDGDPLKPRNATTRMEIVKPHGWEGPRLREVIYAAFQRHRR